MVNFLEILGYSIIVALFVWAMDKFQHYTKKRKEIEDEEKIDRQKEKKEIIRQASRLIAKEKKIQEKKESKDAK